MTKVSALLRIKSAPIRDSPKANNKKAPTEVRALRLDGGDVLPHLLDAPATIAEDPLSRRRGRGFDGPATTARRGEPRDELAVLLTASDRRENALRGLVSPPPEGFPVFPSLFFHPAFTRQTETENLLVLGVNQELANTERGAVTMGELDKPTLLPPDQDDGVRKEGRVLALMIGVRANLLSPIILLDVAETLDRLVTLSDQGDRLFDLRWSRRLFGRKSRGHQLVVQVRRTDLSRPLFRFPSGQGSGRKNPTNVILLIHYNLLAMRLM